MTLYPCCCTPAVIGQCAERPGDDNSLAAPMQQCNIFDCDLKANYHILMVFGSDIPDTSCQQKTI